MRPPMQYTVSAALMSVFMPRKWQSFSQKTDPRAKSFTLSWTWAMPLISIDMGPPPGDPMGCSRTERRPASPAGGRAAAHIASQPANLPGVVLTRLYFSLQVRTMPGVSM